PQILLLAGVPTVTLLAHFLLVRGFPDEHYLRFAALTFAVFAWIALWFYSTGNDTIPESRRYAVEVQLFLVILVVEIFSLAMRSRLRLGAMAAVVAILLAGSAQPWSYCTQGFADRSPAPTASAIEYQVARKLGELHPKGRIFASGGLR